MSIRGHASERCHMTIVNRKEFHVPLYHAYLHTTTTHNMPTIVSIVRGVTHKFHARWVTGNVCI